MYIKQGLVEKIQSKRLRMGVCGLGYVGLPLAVDKAKHGFSTVGFDVQAEKVALDGKLVTVGIIPTRPDTAYGYIRTGNEKLI